MNKYVIQLIAAVLIFVVGGIVGRFLFQPDPPSTNVTKTIVRDTVEIPIEIKETEYKYIEKIDTVFQGSPPIPKVTYSDSLQGEKNNVAYSVQHQVVVSDSGWLSLWDIDLKAKTLQLFETTSYDSVLTIHKTEYLAQPFFLNTWFYTSIAFLATTILLILFGG